MPQRTFDAEADPLPDGFWPGEPIDIPADRGELERLMLDAATVLDRIGGTFSIVALRQELIDADNNPTGLFVPVRFRGKWESFAPAMRAQQPPQAAQEAAPEPPPTPEPEPEPEDIGPDPEAQEAEAEEDETATEDDFGPDAEQALAAQAAGE